ncbi:hypothetical protein EDB89DRAFT_1999790 [Lactarius sanguifluus]|nr:hypothetical protein EDB89DRAFT_1999790 [Lactarius sanguifluus]
MRVSLVAAYPQQHHGQPHDFPHFLVFLCTVTVPPNSKVSAPGWHQVFILDGRTPSHLWPMHTRPLSKRPALLSHSPHFSSLGQTHWVGTRFLFGGTLNIATRPSLLVISFKFDSFSAKLYRRYYSVSTLALISEFQFQATLYA